MIELLRVHISMEQNEKDLEQVMNDFLTTNKDTIKEIEDVNVTRNPDGTFCGTITYTEKEKPPEPNLEAWKSTSFKIGG